MSVFVTTAVWTLKLTTTEKVVLLAFADQADDNGFCWPSIANIMWRTDLTDRGVQTAIRSLVKKGYLRRHQERSGHSTIWHLPTQVIEKNKREWRSGYPRIGFGGTDQKLSTPPNDVPPTPEAGSPPPPNVVPPESSFESSKKRFSRTREEKPKSARANSAQGQKPKPRWYESEAGIDKMGRELGMRPAGTESYSEYQARISAELRRRAGKD